MLFDMVLIVEHEGTFHFQIFPAVEKQVVTSAPRLQWLPLSSVRTFMEIDERVFTSKLSSSSPCTLSKKDILFIFTTMGSKIYLTYLIWIPPTNLCPLPPTSAQTICLQTKTHRESLRESLPEKNMSKGGYMATFGSFVHGKCRYNEGEKFCF